jgi:hypothetical protein
MIIGKLSGIQMHGRSYQGWKNIKTQYQKPIHICFILLPIQIFNVSSLYFLSHPPTPSPRREGE